MELGTNCTYDDRFLTSWSVCGQTYVGRIGPKLCISLVVNLVAAYRVCKRTTSKLPSHHYGMAHGAATLLLLKNMNEYLLLEMSVLMCWGQVVCWSANIDCSTPCSHVLPLSGEIEHLFAFMLHCGVKTSSVALQCKICYFNHNFLGSL